MTNRTEASLSFLAALFVLLSAMFDPRVSAGIAVTCLLAFALFKFTRADRP